MFNINSISLKNFLSVGNVTQAINFPTNTMTLIMGRNLDFQDDGAKNGVGKSTAFSAISYALFGSVLSDIKKDHLINDTNLKDMVVTLDFDVNGTQYRIVRGRKPAILKFYVGNVNSDELVDASNDEAQGDNKETQEHIEKVIGMSHEMFKNIVCLNTYTIPFLSQTAAVQRSIIEQLLGITLLSEKAETLKKLITESKKSIDMEEVKIKANQDANARIEEQILSILNRQDAWLTKQKREISEIENLLIKLSELDSNEELANHKSNASRLVVTDEINVITAELRRLDSDLKREKLTYDSLTKEIVMLGDKKCPTCHSKLEGHNHDDILKSKTELQTKSADNLTKLSNEIASRETILAELNAALNGIPPIAKTYYRTESEALLHKQKMDNVAKQYEDKCAEQDPYVDQIEQMKTSAIVEISHDKINELIKLKEHQDFLLKLLTNKDSFIRKNIIDQNLAFLNEKLDGYVSQMGLNFQVYFQNDLSISINKFGRERSFDNLSRGERTRLILSLSFAFRDVWENLYHPINFLGVDELLDNGLDSVGVSNGLTLLNKFAHDLNKSVFLVSHREELSSKVNNVLIAELESGFTTYRSDDA